LFTLAGDIEFRELTNARKEFYLPFRELISARKKICTARDFN